MAMKGFVKEGALLTVIKQEFTEITLFSPSCEKALCMYFIDL